MLTNQGIRFGWTESTKRLSVSIWATVAVCMVTCNAWAYSVLRPWTVTASGVPNLVTWGFADDGTLIPTNSSSDLIGFLDGVFSVTTSSTDLTQRPWFSLFANSFDRWSQLSGISFAYEGADDGAVLQTSPGMLGVRADIRISGKYIDGPSGALASTWLPDTGDTVLDTGDVAYYSGMLTGGQKPRNTLKHEIGHALGLMHVVSSDTVLLMEPYTSPSIDGPQLDDIRGIQALYGDVNEKANNGLGNGTANRATGLGLLEMGDPLSVGVDAADDQKVLATETDFVSITDNSDADYYSFTVSTPGVLVVSLTPWGGVFSQGPSAGLETMVDATSQSDLSLAVFGPNGTTLLGSANRASAGGIEVLTGLPLATAGTYFVRVLGATDEVQLYELDLALTEPSSFVAGDFNTDGVVDGGDYLTWQRSFGNTGIDLPADGNGDGTINSADLAVWQSNYGHLTQTTLVSVPEPSGIILLTAAMIACGSVGRRGDLAHCSRAIGDFTPPCPFVLVAHRCTRTPWQLAHHVD